MIKQQIRRLINRFGYDVARIGPTAWDVAGEHFHMRRNLTLFDGGANRGDTTQIMLDRFECATVFAFEPHPAMVTILKQRFSRNSKVVPLAVALADRDGMMKFHLNDVPDTSSLLPTSNSADRFGYGKVMRTESVASVQSRTIDSIASEYKIDQIDLLKLDLQGGEFLALRGAERMLKEKRVEMILTEVFFVQAYDGQVIAGGLFRYLAQFGFEILGLYSLRVRGEDGTLLECDCLLRQV
jgi:FkbM family methyltransferase